MPPARSTANPPKRRVPFKPPRPINLKPSDTSNAASKPGIWSANENRPNASDAPSLGLRLKPVSLSPESEGDDVESIAYDDSEGGNNVESSPATPSELAIPTSSQQVGPPIPQKLLVKLLHEGFEGKDVRIGREATAVISKYIETFVREALARAAYERQEADGGAGLGDGFLQVEDLEKLAPQLLLDF